LLHSLLAHAENAYDDLSSPARVMHAWETAANLPGAHYRIAVDGEPEPFEATALHLRHGGALLVEHDGTQREITMADARVLR
jgi:hypothetical protein